MIVKVREDKVHCAGEHMPAQSHPRIFLTLKEGKAVCGYCGTQFVLVP